MVREEVKNIFLSGICGTGMASLAGMLKESGYAVSGSDAAVYPPMSTFLKDLQITINQGFDENNLKVAIPDLIVIGNALSRGNPEVEYALDQGLRMASLPEVLRDFFIRGKHSTVVAGTHGKTTTTAMLAWLLASAGRDPSFFAGGIAENFGSSFRLGRGADFVIEGDEYDTAFFDKASKFLHYLPRTAVIKNIEFDHADIYANIEAVKLSFTRLINIVPRTGLLIAGVESKAVAELLPLAHSRVITFGLEEGDWRAQSLAEENGGTAFDVVLRGQFWHRFHISLIGEFNVLNALSAIAAGADLGLSAEEMDTAFGSFQNVRRRLELRGEVGGVRVYDDFAHHPTAVRETLKSVRAQFSNKRIWAVFEPRSQTSRRSLFEGEFSAALRLADVAIVAPVHEPSNIDSKERLSPERVVETIQRTNGQAYALASVDEIITFIVDEIKGRDVVVIMSNGSFGGIHERLLQRLKESERRSGEGTCDEPACS